MSLWRRHLDKSLGISIMAQIEIINLSKKFQDNGLVTHVLQGIDLNIEAGERLMIVGASGAGKSTLLHIIGTLDQPSEGLVKFEGVNVFKKTEKELCAFRNEIVGFVFQFHHLLPDFTAVENVSMPLLIRGLPQSRAHRQSLEMLERVGLGHRKAHRPTQLSGGEQQRVAIARALVGSPRVVFADEPTGNLDAKTGEKVFDLLLSLNKELKTTLLVVTHNEELTTSFEKTVRLVDGKIAKA